MISCVNVEFETSVSEISSFSIIRWILMLETAEIHENILVHAFLTLAPDGSEGLASWPLHPFHRRLGGCHKEI